MKIHELVTRCALARESANPMAAMREVLESLRSDVAEIEHALSYVSGTGGNARQVFYRSPDLTLLKVRFPNGRRTPPHDHGTARHLGIDPAALRRGKEHAVPH